MNSNNMTNTRVCGEGEGLNLTAIKEVESKGFKHVKGGFFLSWGEKDIVGWSLDIKKGDVIFSNGGSGI